MTFLQRPLWLATGLICFLLLGIGILRVATFGVAAEVPTSEVEPRAAVAADLAAPVLGPEAAPVLAPTTAPAVASAAAAPAAIPTVAVPAVGAMPFDEAARQLRGAGLEVQTTEEVTLDTPRGIVVSQEPPAGASVRPGEPVRLLVSTGIRVPDLRGQHWDDVNAWLDQHGWPLAKARFIVADRPVWGQVVGQSPLPDEGPVADKASASLSLEIAGPPEATRTGFPRASSAAESGASETEAETEPAAGAIPARALVQPGPAAQSAPAAPPQLVPAVAPAQAPPPAAPVQAPAAPPPAPRRAAPPPPPPPPPPAPRAEPARREPARAEVRKPDRRAEDEDRKRGGDRSAPGRREDDDDD